MLIAFFLVFKPEIINAYHSFFNFVLKFANMHPLYAIFAIAILPLFGFPVTTIYLTCGMLYSINNSLWIFSIGVIINFSLSYFLVHSSLKRWIESKIKEHWKNREAFFKNRGGPFILALRLIPGLPFFAQNYILSLCGVSFGKYLFYSFIGHFPYMLCNILLGRALFNENLVMIISALCFMVLLFFIVKHLKGKKLVIQKLG